MGLLDLRDLLASLRGFVLLELLLSLFERSVVAALQQFGVGLGLQATLCTLLLPGQLSLALGFLFGSGILWLWCTCGTSDPTAESHIQHTLRDCTCGPAVRRLLAQPLNEFLLRLVDAFGDQVLREPRRGFLRGFFATGNERPLDVLEAPRDNFIRQTTHDPDRGKCFQRTGKHAKRSRGSPLFIRGLVLLRTHAGFTRTCANTHSSRRSSAGNAERRRRQERSHGAHSLAQLSPDGLFVTRGRRERRFGRASYIGDTATGRGFVLIRQQRRGADGGLLDHTHGTGHQPLEGFLDLAADCGRSGRQHPLDRGLHDRGRRAVRKFKNSPVRQNRLNRHTNLIGSCCPARQTEYAWCHRSLPARQERRQ